MASEKIDTAIIVFTKFPVEGKVKTRLAKNMGNKFAVSFYRVCAEHTFKELVKVKETGSELFLFFSEENEIEQVMKWVGNNFNYYWFINCSCRIYRLYYSCHTGSAVKFSFTCNFRISN